MTGEVQQVSRISDKERTREMRSAQTYLEIVKSRGQRKLPLERVYRNMRHRELFLIAYGKLTGNKGATTPGIDPEDTIDGMNLKRIDRIIHQLKTGTYQWKPVRRTYINKKNSTKKRPIGQPSFNDKLVQEVIRMILEAYYEPQFSDLSHGFRSGRGCHTALKEVSKWNGTKWFIEGDVANCFDGINHEILLNIIQRSIPDRRFIKLLKGLLEAGYMEDWQYNNTYSGVPQGGVLSPILSNILLNEFDQYIENILIPQYTKGSRRRANPEYADIQRQIIKAKTAGKRQKITELYHELRKHPAGDPTDNKFCRLKFCRYADDWILGLTGTKAEAEAIKQQVSEFLKTIGLELSTEKTLITHAASEKARFLGYNIYCSTSNRLTTSKTGSLKNAKTRAISYKIMLSVPQEVTNEWLKKYSQNGKPTHRNELLNHSDFDIINAYGWEFQGLVNYYCMAFDVSRHLYRVKHTMTKSLAKTLAAKRKKSVAWVYRTYKYKFETGVTGFRLVIDRKPPKKPLTAKYGAKPIHYNRNPSYIKDEKAHPLSRRTELIDRLLADECELCSNTEEVQVHHVRALKDVKKKYAGKRYPPQWAIFMMERNRKTVVVCRECHLKIHKGVYDGPKVAQDLLESRI
jgi:group II intron reverse transcriptase/maturase